MPRLREHRSRARAEPRQFLRTALALSIAVLTGLALPAPVTALEIARIQIGDLVLEAPVALETELAQLADASRRIVPNLERDLGVSARGPYRIVLIPGTRPLDPEIQQLDALAPPWAAGFMVGSLRLGAIRIGEVRRYPYDSAEEVLAHEIVHMLLYDAAGHPLPAWFSEGVATWEGRRRGVRDFVISASAVLAREPPTLAQIDAQFRAGSTSARQAYAASLDFVAWSVRRHGPDFVPRVIARLGDLPVEEAWEITADESLADSEERWRQRSVWIHRWLPLIGSTSTLWIGISLLAVLAGLARRHRDREMRARWEAEDRMVVEAAEGSGGSEGSR